MQFSLNAASQLAEADTEAERGDVGGWGPCCDELVLTQPDV